MGRGQGRASASRRGGWRRVTVAPAVAGPLSRSRQIWTLALVTIVYTLNIADRFVLSALIEPIKAEFGLSDGGVAFLTGTSLALFYVAAGLPLGVLADRTNRRNMLAWAAGLWSFFTLLCGLSQSFVQLLLSRIGVGIGEAGGSPPSQSLLADIFPAHQRPVAMSIFALGTSLGAAIGTGVAGWLAGIYGWRGPLIVFGLIGIPFALMVRYTLREPARGNAPAMGLVAGHGLRTTLRFIGLQKSLVHLLIGHTIIVFAGGGLVFWTPAFLMRSHGLTVGEAGAMVGLMNGVGGLVVLVATIWAMARLSRHDVRWQLWYIAIATVITSGAAVVGYAAESTLLMAWMLWIFVPCTYISTGPTLALCQSLVPASMRGQTIAIMLFVSNVALLVLAPQLIGSFSDILAPQLGDSRQSLRWLLVFGAATGFWGAWHHHLACRTLKADLARAGN